MVVSKKSRVKKIIQQLAEQEGVTPETIRASMQEAIDAAWDNKNSSSAIELEWHKYFPSGEKPSLEEFIIRISSELFLC